jgi:hypothetical protein
MQPPAVLDERIDWQVAPSAIFGQELRGLGEVSREFNIQAVAHPHAGSNLEFEDEVE